MAEEKTKLSALSLFATDDPPTPDVVVPKEKPKEDEPKDENKEELRRQAQDLIPSDEQIEERAKNKPKDKPTQFSELRKAKDELQKKNEELEKQIAELNGKQGYQIPEDLSEVFDPFKDDDNPVSALAHAHKARLDEIQKLKDRVEKQTNDLREFGINNDPEFKKEFIDPFNDAQESLKLDLFRVNAQGELVHSEHFQSLYNNLIQQVDKSGGKVDARTVKAQLTAFKDAYEKDTGEEWDMPRPQAIVDGLRNMVSTFQKMSSGKENFEAEQKRLKEERELTNHRAQQEKVRQQASLRKSQTSEYIDSFDFQSHEDLGSEQELRQKFQEAFQKADGFISDPSTVPTFPEMVRNFVYLSEFERIRKEHAEMKARLAELNDDGVGAGSSSSAGGSKDPEKKIVSSYALFDT